MDGWMDGQTDRQTVQECITLRLEDEKTYILRKQIILMSIGF
jgi:hypothetical protein